MDEQIENDQVELIIDQLISGKDRVKLEENLSLIKQESVDNNKDVDKFRIINTNGSDLLKIKFVSKHPVELKEKLKEEMYRSFSNERWNTYGVVSALYSKVFGSIKDTRFSNANLGLVIQGDDVNTGYNLINVKNFMTYAGIYNSNNVLEKNRWALGLFSMKVNNSEILKFAEIKDSELLTLAYIEESTIGERAYVSDSEIAYNSSNSKSNIFNYSTLEDVKLANFSTNSDVSRIANFSEIIGCSIAENSNNSQTSIAESAKRIIDSNIANNSTLDISTVGLFAENVIRSNFGQDAKVKGNSFIYGKGFFNNIKKYIQN
jgi:hypothetical protein